MEAKAKQFLDKVHSIFGFLQQEFGYIKDEMGIKDQGYFKDAHIVQSYKSQKVGIDIYWYFAQSSIGIALYEIKGKKKPKYFGASSDDAMGVNLQTLVHMKNDGDVREFLLGGTYRYKRSIKKKTEMIEQDLDGILINLRAILLKYAKEIIEGDTSIFPQVLKYNQKLIDERY